MTLTERLHHAAAPIWQQTLKHPFVTRLGDGTLALENFQFYMCQDYIFLIEYSRLLALATARAPDLDTMERFADLLEVDYRRVRLWMFARSAAAHRNHWDEDTLALARVLARGFI